MTYSKLQKATFSFFEQPESYFAKIVHGFIILLILLSGGEMMIEYGYETVFKGYELYFHYFDTFVLAVFTIEYLLRLWSAPKKLKFLFGFYNLIDFFAIAPAYLSIANTAGIRSLRLLRLLRLSRIVRVFRVFRYSRFAGVIFGIKNTILEKILPVITIFTLAKFCIFFLETRGWWLQDYNLETTFAVVGFVLGIILSQKIGVAYTKFILLEDSVTKIHGFVVTINTVLKEHYKKKKTVRALHEWVQTFYAILLRTKSKHQFYEINEKLYKEIHKLIVCSHGYSELIRVYSRLNEEASFILNRMDALTPKAYDRLLHRSTLIYSIMMIIFLPGVTGVISTLVATYVLYGMYQVTDDMDHAMTHLQDQLINADINDLAVLKEKLN